LEVSYLTISGPEYVLPAMRVTQNKTHRKLKKPKLDTWLLAIVSEHSPIRSATYRIFCQGVPYFVVNHFVRHNIGVQFYVGSQRLLGELTREELPQNNLVDFFFDCNLQALISIARRRLCTKSNKVTRELMGLIKASFEDSDDKYDKVIGRLLLPPCEWAGICPEKSSCKKGISTLFERHKNILENL